MTTVAQARARRSAIAQEMRGLHDTAAGAPLDDAGQTRWNALEAEARSLNGIEDRAVALDELDRRAAGTPVQGSGDARFDDLVGGVGLLDVIRAQMPGVTDAAAGRAREASQEMARRSGRKVEGLLFHMGTPEQRTLSTVAPAGGPGSNLIGSITRSDLFIDRLRSTTRVRALGATVLGGLVGNLSIPRRTASSAIGWFADDTALPISDPSFASISLSPKHAGCVTSWSRNLVLQSSPDVERLARADLSAQLAEMLDTAAIAGTGQNAQPLGILNTPGISIVSAGTNGGVLSFDMIADLIGAIADANADGSSLGFLTNSRVRRALSKIKDTAGNPLGLDVLFQGKPVAYSNIVSNTGTKGSGTGLSSVLYGNWSELLIGVWSELDILVNPYETTAYSKGGVSIRAAMSVDLAVRHAASFAAVTDVIA